MSILDVRVVVERQADRAVPGEGLGDLRVDAAPREAADERVSQRVKVNVPAAGVNRGEEVGALALLPLVGVVLGLREPRRAGCLKVGAQHAGRAPAVGDCERRRLRRLEEGNKGISGPSWLGFMPGIPCPWDGEPTPNGDVGINDFLELLAQWGSPGSCDFDGGGVGINAFLDLLANWGPCP